MLTILSIAIDLDVISQSHFRTTNERFDVISCTHFIITVSKSSYHQTDDVVIGVPWNVIKRRSNKQEAIKTAKITFISWCFISLSNTKDVSMCVLAVGTPAFSYFIHLQSEIIVILR